MTYVLSGTIYSSKNEVQDINPLNIKIDEGATTADVLELLKKDFGITSFIRDGKLFVGIQAYSTLQKEVKFQFYKNIVDFSELVVKKKEDTDIRIKYVSVDSRTNEIIATVFSGASNGQTQTTKVQDVNQSDLQKLADNTVSQYRYDGIFGNFTAFLEPFCRIQNKVTLINEIIKDYNGSYICKAVTYRFGMNGARQDIEIGYKLG